jgi:hypothetical protein
MRDRIRQERAGVPIPNFGACCGATFRNSESKGH